MSGERGRPKIDGLTERRREQILAEATRVFAKQGFPKTDLQVIADRLKLGKGTLYRYFPSKEALFLAAADRGMTLLREFIESRTDEESDPLRRVEIAIAEYIRFFDRNPEITELMIQERAEFRDRKKPTYFIHREANIGKWNDLFADLIKAKRVRKISPETITEILSGLLYGTMFINHFVGRKKSAERQARETIDVIFRGILETKK